MRHGETELCPLDRLAFDASLSLDQIQMFLDDPKVEADPASTRRVRFSHLSEVVENLLNTYASIPNPGSPR